MKYDKNKTEIIPTFRVDAKLKENFEEAKKVFGVSSTEVFKKAMEELIEKAGLDSLDTPFPTINLVKKMNLDYRKYLKEGYWFLGYTNKPFPKEGIPNALQKKIEGTDLYTVYLDNKVVENHKIIIGNAGSGVSTFLASESQSVMMNFDSIDLLLIHDFQGLENKRFEDLKKKNPKFKDRIHTSDTMEQLYSLLIKVQAIYEYRKAIMNKNGWTNWQGGNIRVIIDNYNIGFDDLNSSDSAIRRLTIETERIITTGQFLFRETGIFFNILGQSHLESKNINTTICNQSAIQFFLNVSPSVANKCEIATENGIALERYPRGKTLYTNKNNGTFIEFLPPYIPENYLDDFVDFTPKPRQQIDLQMNNYLINLEEGMIKKYQTTLVKSQKQNKMSDEEIEETVEMYSEDVHKSIEELRQDIYIPQTEIRDLKSDAELEKEKEHI